MILLSMLLFAGIDPGLVNNAAPSETVGPRSRGPATLRAQILLSRARFSIGEIDGVYGRNTARALRAFRVANALPPGDTVDAATWPMLEQFGGVSVILSYVIDKDELARPFAKVPTDMMAKAKLTHLPYESALEGLAEKFHCSPKLLHSLNPGKRFKQAGEEIQVPNLSGLPSLPQAAIVVVDESESSVTALDAMGKTIASYPASMGSEYDPLPIGDWKVKGIFRNPVFHYNPALFWDADPSHAKARIPAGPNNPVGVVWIDLSKEHYGIHGAPDPSTIGKAQSHGCIRLTNWDAAELAGSVAKGTPVILQK